MRSMTGYAKTVEIKDSIEVSVEVKTLNSKYLSTNLSLPSYLSPCEIKLNELVGKHVKRGKVNLRVYIRFMEPPDIFIDFATAEAYYSALEELSSRLGIPEPVRLEDLLKFKEIMRFDIKDEEVEKICKLVGETVEKTLEKLVEERKIEGEKLKRILKGFLDDLKDKVNSINEKASELLEYYSKTLRENVEKILPDDVMVDQNVLETAIAVLAERADVREEVDRLKSHISRAYDMIEEDGSIGPNLDFLAQEMLREFNTILSKSKLVEISEKALEGKVIVNSFREQVQNVE
jgi:uncharacterized protein (TIGR00255 family)